MTGNRWAACASLLGLLLLSACVTQPTGIAPDLAQRKARLEALTEFRFNGGLGIWSDEQAISARLLWEQQPDMLTVQLSGPLGIGNMQLTSLPEGATLSRAGSVVASGDSAGHVLQRGLGLSAVVPVSQLQMWVKGLAGDARTFVADSQGKLSSLRYTDEEGTRWEARFLKYSLFDELELPSLITASGGPYSIRLVLKNWQATGKNVVPKRTESHNRLAIPTR